MGYHEIDNSLAVVVALHHPGVSYGFAGDVGQAVEIVYSYRCEFAEQYGHLMFVNGNEVALC